MRCLLLRDTLAHLQDLLHAHVLVAKGHSVGHQLQLMLAHDVHEVSTQALQICGTCASLAIGRDGLLSTGSCALPGCRAGRFRAGSQVLCQDLHCFTF